MRDLILGLALLAASPVGAMEAYRWVDQNGAVHYSDQPQPGAEKIEVTPAPKVGTVTPAMPPHQAAPDAPFRYTDCAISSPQPEQVLDNQNSLSVALSLRPALRPTDHIEVTLNGQRLQRWPGSATTYQLTDLERGTYSLGATILGPKGRPLCSAAAVTFYVRLPSILTPGARAAPR